MAPDNSAVDNSPNEQQEMKDLHNNRSEDAGSSVALINWNIVNEQGRNIHYEVNKSHKKTREELKFPIHTNPIQVS